MSSDFKTKDFSLRVQKKLLSRLSNKTIANSLVDENTAALLDKLYKLCLNVCGDKGKADKVVKNIIKIVVKIGVLIGNNQFNEDEVKKFYTMQTKFVLIAKTVASFNCMKYSYDRQFLQDNLQKLCGILTELISGHLSVKSIDRINYVFQFFTDAHHLDAIFSAAHADILSEIIVLLDKIEQQQQQQRSA